MNERPLALLSGSSALASISIEHLSTALSALAALAAVAAAIPVIIDRYRRWLPAKVTRLFPAKPPTRDE